MKDLKCPITGMSIKFAEVFGVVLIVIATILTIVTGSSLGIAAMFIAGGLLCCRSKRGCCCTKDCPCCSKSCDESICTEGTSVKSSKKKSAE